MKGDDVLVQAEKSCKMPSEKERQSGSKHDWYRQTIYLRRNGSLNIQENGFVVRGKLAVDRNDGLHPSYISQKLPSESPKTLLCVAQLGGHTLCVGSMVSSRQSGKWRQYSERSVREYRVPVFV